VWEYIVLTLILQALSPRALFFCSRHYFRWVHTERVSTAENT
jgi:hypothetical protein